MSTNTTENEVFHRWLDERMKESHLTPDEAAEFTRWLMANSCDDPETGHVNSSVSFTEVLQLVSWVRGRMSGLLIQRAERQEFSAWLASKLSAHSCLTEQELHQVRKELTGQSQL